MKTPIALVGMAVFLTGCTGVELSKSQNLDAGGSTFTASLYEGYLDLAKGEFAEGDYQDTPTSSHCAHGPPPVATSWRRRKSPRARCPSMPSRTLPPRALSWFRR